MDLSYVAYSERTALLLDEEGICRWVVPLNPNATENDLTLGRKCVGAQFVASLDASAPGLLDEQPRVGSRLLLIRVDEGRAKLMRFGPIVRFETLDEPEPMNTVVERITAMPIAAMPIVEVPAPQPPVSDVSLTGVFEQITTGGTPFGPTAAEEAAAPADPDPSTEEPPAWTTDDVMAAAVIVPSRPILFIDAAPQRLTDVGLEPPSVSYGYGTSPLDVEYASWAYPAMPPGPQPRLFLR